MKKIYLGVAVLISMVFSLQAQINKEELFARMAQRYSGVDNISVEYEINMPMMGSIMKMPVNFYQKGNKVKMDMKMNQQGMPQPMEMSMLMDGNKIVQYNKTMNMATVINLDKLPESMRQLMKNQQSGFMVNSYALNEFSKFLDKIIVEEKTKDGKGFYLITLTDIANLSNVAPGMGMQGSTSGMFKKMLLWINSTSLLPEKIEIYGDSNTLAIWVDILDIKMEHIPDSIFKLDIPSDATYMDMTESIKKMQESMNIK